MHAPATSPPLRWRESGLVLALVLQVGSGAAAYVGAAAVVERAFPLIAVGLASWLLARSRREAYVEYVLWLWLVAPWVRRMVDLGSGWSPISPVMLAAPAATILCLLPALRGRRSVDRTIGGALVVALVAVGYGCVVGVLTSGPVAALGALATWLPPIAVGLYVATAGPRYAELLAIVRRTALIGCAVLGTYGLVQFFTMPLWDAFWMRNAPINSIGYPYPFQVRVFSTLNSSAPFGVVMATLLVLLTGVSARLRWLAGLVGVLSLGLSLVRTAWLGYAVSLLALFSPRRGRLLRAGVVSLVVPVTLVLVVGGPAKDALVDRFATTTELGQSDTSFRERVAFHERLLPEAVADPFGTGLGAVGVATKLTSNRGKLDEDANFDGGALELLFTYGVLVGTGVLVTSVLAVAAAWRRARPRADLERAMAAALVGLVVQLLLYQPLLTPSGILFYLLLGILARPADDPDDVAQGAEHHPLAATAVEMDGRRPSSTARP